MYKVAVINMAVLGLQTSKNQFLLIRESDPIKLATKLGNKIIGNKINKYKLNP